jgi:FkbM family methyltransferase
MAQDGTWKPRALSYLNRSPLVRKSYARLKKVPFFGGALQKLARTLVPRGARVWLEIPAGLGKGLWLHLDPRFEMEYATGHYEPLIESAMLSGLRTGSIFYDVGAHIGIFSLLAARVVGKGGSVFAFEADPDNAQRIREHAHRNGLDQIHVVDRAVWSAPGKLTFQRALVDSSRNQGAVASGPQIPNENTTEVDAVSLDSFLLDHTAPTLIKMDIEGGEIEALKGSETTFALNQPMIICELHNPAAVEFVTQWLTSKHYDLVFLEESNALPRHIVARKPG